MSISQTVRYAPSNPANTTNPTYIVPDIVNITTQLFGAGVPAANVGVVGNVYTDVTTGFQYQMTVTGWEPTIALGSFAVVPDPLSINELDVSNIKPQAANIQVTLPLVGDSVNVGVAGNLTNLQLQGDGSVISDSATAAHVVANGLGAQVTYGSAAITSSGTTLTMTGDTGLSVGTNTGDLNVNIPGAINVVSTNPFNFTVGGNPSLAVQAGAIAVSTSIEPTASFSYNLGSPANIFSELHINTVFHQNGSNIQPSVTFDNDTASGMYLISPSHVGLVNVSSINASSSLTDNRVLGVNESGTLNFYKPEQVLLFNTTSVPIADGTYFLTNAAPGSGTIEGTYFDNNYVIKKVTACVSSTSTFNFNGGSATLNIGHVPSGTLVSAGNFVTDFSASLNTGAPFFNYSSGNQNVAVSAANLCGRLVLAGTLPTGAITSFIVAVYLQAN
jgi:hypothetical protein